MATARTMQRARRAELGIEADGADEDRQPDAQLEVESLEEDLRGLVASVRAPLPAVMASRVHQVARCVLQVFSDVVINSLAPALIRSMLACTWRLRFQILNAAQTCFTEWLNAVRTRISRSFLPKVPGQERQLLKDLRTILDRYAASAAACAQHVYVFGA